MASARARDRTRLVRIYGKDRLEKTAAEIEFVRAKMDDCGSIDFARALAQRLALRIGGRWWTPPTASGCLPGVERGRLLEEGRLHERVLRVPDLHEAERVAVCNSLRGWRQATLITDGPGRPVAAESSTVGGS